VCTYAMIHMYKMWDRYFPYIHFKTWGHAAYCKP